MCGGRPFDNGESRAARTINQVSKSDIFWNNRLSYLLVQRDPGVRKEALRLRHVAEGTGGVGAEREDERRAGLVAGVVAVLDDAALMRMRAVDESDAEPGAALDRRDPAAVVLERHRPRTDDGGAPAPQAARRRRPKP